jgi:predicted nucleotidyltransferase
MVAEAISAKADAISALARRHGISRIRVFGSVATGRARPTSDLDLLVDLQAGRDLLDLIEFKLDLEETLGRKVDVVTERALSRHLRPRILREARPL